MYRFRFVSVLAVGLALVGTAVGFGQPRSEVTISEGIASTVNSDRLLVIYVDAEACSDCDRMNQRTWTSPAVKRWFELHGDVVHVDATTHQEWATANRVRSYPTMIIYKHGREFDRVVGAKEPSPLLAWLDGANEGTRSVDELRERAGDPDDPTAEHDIKAHLELARSLFSAGQYTDAATEYAWLWTHIPTIDARYLNDRHSTMAEEMKELASVDESARETFVTIRVSTASRFRDMIAMDDDLADWIVLCNVLGEHEIILEWYDRVKDDPHAEAALHGVSDLLYDVCVSQQRWADAGTVLPDPTESAESCLARVRPRSEEADGLMHLSESRQRDLEQYRDEMAMLYATCLAANRDAEAKQIAGLLLKSHNNAGARLALVAAAIRTESVRPHQSRLLEKAAELGLAVDATREQLDRALAQRATEIGDLAEVDSEH